MGRAQKIEVQMTLRKRAAKAALMAALAALALSASQWAGAQQTASLINSKTVASLSNWKTASFSNSKAAAGPLSNSEAAQNSAASWGEQGQASTNSPPSSSNAAQQSSANAAPQAQAPATSATQPATTITADVNLVTVLATVRNKKGEVVRDLGRDDFKIEDDGKPQAIKFFARETDLPLKVGLLVDTSGSMMGAMNQERTASLAFFNKVLRPEQDLAFLEHFDHEVELMQDFTASREKLQEALDRLGRPDFARTGTGDGSGAQQDPGGRGPGRGGRRFGGGTTLYDAVFLASDELMRSQKGRKAIIVLSDGEDRGSKVTLERAIESAQHSDTLVYTVLMQGEERHDFGGFGGGGMGRGGMGRRGGQWPGGGERHEDGKKVMERMAKETGGHFFQVSKKDNVDKVFAAIEDELRSQYSLGFTPDRDLMTPAFHKLVVTAKPKDMSVQAREGYYGAAQQTGEAR